jgi:hypothetical protein
MTAFYNERPREQSPAAGQTDEGRSAARDYMLPRKAFSVGLMCKGSRPAAMTSSTCCCGKLNRVGTSPSSAARAGSS